MQTSRTFLQNLIDFTSVLAVFAAAFGVAYLIVWLIEAALR